MSETSYNRRPVRFIEIEQPRCVNRYGTAPCTATGTPLCYNTFWTCRDRENYTPTEVIRWRFYDGQNGTPWLYQTLSTNVLTNGTFDTDLSGWTVTGATDWAWDSGVARLTSDGGLSDSLLQQDFERDVEKPYSFDQEVVSGSGLTVAANDSLGENSQVTLSSEEGSGTFTGTIPSGYDRIQFINSSGSATEVTLDNVSVGNSTKNGIATNAFPVLRSASTLPSRVNLGGQSENESPFGRRAKLTVSIDEFPFDDHVGDFYLGDVDRTTTTAGFWAKFLARNPFYPNTIVRDYQGYEGQALSDMVTREYVLDNIEQDSPKRVTLTARDPLDLASDKKAKFPSASDIQLLRDISDNATDVEVFCVETELSEDYGNTGSTRYLKFGSEIIRYTGWTGTEPEFTLTGVVRGVLGSEAASHGETDSGQRVGRYEDIRLYSVAQDLLENHTTIPSRFYDFTQWDAEGDVWLPTLRTTATVSEPVAVEKLMAELSRDGLFYVWWDEREQTIPMRAIKPPQETPLVWSDADNIVADSFEERAESDDFITRVILRYDQIDPTESLDSENNYRVQSRFIDAESESEDATGGAVREKTIFSRWITTDSNALLVSASLILQYKFIPRYLTIEIDAKDRAAGIGSIIDLDTRHKVDTEGNRRPSRFQIIEFEEVQPSERARVEMQSFQFIGKFAIIMANDAPDYATATDEERLAGCWISENTGLMPNGDEPYLLQ